MLIFYSASGNDISLNIIPEIKEGMHDFQENICISYFSIPTYTQYGLAHKLIQNSQKLSINIVGNAEKYTNCSSNIRIK